MSERGDSVAGDVESMVTISHYEELLAERDRLAARCEELERERDEERERFGRHVETMIEPKLLARAQAAESLLEEAKTVLKEVTYFGDRAAIEIVLPFIAKLEAR